MLEAKTVVVAAVSYHIVSRNLPRFKAPSLTVFILFCALFVVKAVTRS